MTVVTVSSFSAALKDYYPAPGTRIKQYVVDTYRENKWERETCPRFTMPAHDDNTDAPCRNAIEAVPWTYLDHDCCYFCGDHHEQLRALPEVQAWLAERAKRPPIESDRSKFSDEIAPELSFAAHPLLAKVP